MDEQMWRRIERVRDEMETEKPQSAHVEQLALAVLELARHVERMDLELAQHKGHGLARAHMGRQPNRKSTQ